MNNFSKSYTENPIVNAMCVGIVDKENLVTATAGDPGNLLLLVGSETGRDGIHWASGLASKTFEDDLISVLIPTTPNPTTGFLLMFKRKDLIYLDLKPDEAIKFIVSCGVIHPGNMPPSPAPQENF